MAAGERRVSRRSGTSGSATPRGAVSELFQADTLPSRCLVEDCALVRGGLPLARVVTSSISWFRLGQQAQGNIAVGSQLGWAVVYVIPMDSEV